MYLLAHYGWMDCYNKRDLFIQGITSVFNTIITILILFYIILMPEPGPSNFKSVLLPFIILYGIQSGISVLNTYLFIDSHLYLGKMHDCSPVYFRMVYTNTVLGLIPHYMLTIYLILAGCWKVISGTYSSCQTGLDMVTTQETQTFINPAHLSGISTRNRPFIRPDSPITTVFDLELDNELDAQEIY